MAELSDTPNEEWRAIPGHSGYEASNLGRVRGVDRTLPDGRRWRGTVLRQKLTRHGYLVTQLATGSSRGYRHASVHNLVLEAFVGARPSPDHQAAHFDGDRLNNRLTNLRWATAFENAGDRERHGRTFHPKGALHPMAKLDAETVLLMRRMKREGSVTVDDMASMTGVSRWTIFDALSGRTWSHI
jgi:hypothetical protein